MYRVTFNRVNDSMFTGVKYAEIYPDWDWVSGSPITIKYALTWRGLRKKVDRWLYQHQFDVTM
jgi:hypothetical protein